MQEALWCDPNFVAFWKWQNYRNDEKIRNCQGLGEGGRGEQLSTKEF